MKKDYSPIDCGFHDVLLSKATLREYCKIQYYTEIKEFITTNSLIKDVFTKDGEEFMELTLGENIRLDRVVSINGMFAPNYSTIKDFTCDC